jgi:hypothetical protein
VNILQTTVNGRSMNSTKTLNELAPSLLKILTEIIMEHDETIPSELCFEARALIDIANGEKE